VPVPTPRAALLVGLCALLALVVPGWFAVPLAAVVLAAAAVDASRVRAAPGVCREVPLLLSRGVPEPLRLRCDDPAAELAQSVPPGLALGPLLPDPDGPPGAAVAELVASRRGRHVLPPVRVRRTGPWGLGARTYAGAGEAVVSAYPDLPAARRLVRAVRTSVPTAPGSSLRGPLGLGTDFEALRDYLPDDDVRLVNWRATARLGRPMSNTYRVEQSRRVLLAVDCGRLMAAPLSGATRLDAAVDAAAAVALAAEAVGDRLALLAYDDTPRATVRATTRAGGDVVRTLAGLEPRAVDSDPELVLRALPRAARATLLLFTDLLDPDSARGLLAVVPPVAARHAVTVVAAVDEDLAAVLRRPPATRQEAGLLAAAADLQEERLRTRALLRRAGATVIEASPARLAAACVAAYSSGRAALRA